MTICAMFRMLLMGETRFASPSTSRARYTVAPPLMEYIMKNKASILARKLTSVYATITTKMDF